MAAATKPIIVHVACAMRRPARTAWPTKPPNVALLIAVSALIGLALLLWGRVLHRALLDASDHFPVSIDLEMAAR